MNKLFLIVVSVVALQGCFHQNTSKIDIKKAVEFCGSVDKVWEIQVNFLGGEYITCTDYSTVFGDGFTLGELVE